MQIQCKYMMCPNYNYNVFNVNYFLPSGGNVNYYYLPGTHDVNKLLAQHYEPTQIISSRRERMTEDTLTAQQRDWWREKDMLLLDYLAITCFEILRKSCKYTIRTTATHAIYA